jgi:uncharacterized protein YukE
MSAPTTDLSACRRHDPSSYLTVPPAADLNPGQELADALGPIVGTFNRVLEMICHVDLMDEFVTKPFLGDWDQLEAAACAHANAGRAVEDIADTLNCLRMAVADSWEGQAADAFQQRLDELVKVLDQYPPKAEKMAELLRTVLEAAEALKDMIKATIDVIYTVAAAILATLLDPIPGDEVVALAGGSTAVAASVQRVIAFVKKVYDVIDAISSIITAFWGSFDATTNALEAGCGQASAAELADALAAWAESFRASLRKIG